MGVDTHLITNAKAMPMLLRDGGGLVIAVGVTPGWLRSEPMLEHRC